MLGGEGKEPDPGATEECHPGVSVEANRVKELVKNVVDPPEILVGARQTPGLVAADHAVESPVDANSKLKILEGVDRRLRSVPVIGIHRLCPAAFHCAAIECGVESFVPALGTRLGLPILSSVDECGTPDGRRNPADSGRRRN